MKKFWTILLITISIAACKKDSQSLNGTYKGSYYYHFVVPGLVDSTLQLTEFDTSFQASFEIVSTNPSTIVMKDVGSVFGWLKDDLTFHLNENDSGYIVNPGGSGFFQHQIRLQNERLTYSGTVKCGIPCTRSYTFIGFKE